MAIELADESGLEALSMRRLAQALGVEAMTLYHHVRNKADLLDSIAELVVAEIAVPEPGEAWRSGLRRMAVSAHEQFIRHRWAASLTLTTRLRPARARYMDEMLRCLRGGGFTASLAHHAYHAVESHVVGHSLWLSGIRSGIAAYDADIERILRQLPLEAYPFLGEHIEQHRIEEEAGATALSEFEFGLELILDGLERFLGRA